MPDDLIARVDALAEKATKGELRIREMGRDFFVERPKQLGEAYGVEILGDDSYPTKRGDAELIVALVNAWPQLRELALAGMAARWIPVSERLPDTLDDVLTCSITGRVECISAHTVRWAVNAAIEDGDQCYYARWMPLPEAPREGT